MWLRADSPFPLNLPLAKMRPGDTSEPTDEALLSQIACGDHRAFHQLVQRYHPRVHRLARRTLGTTETVNDIVQEAFLRVWTHAGNWQSGRASFYTWLYRVVVNLCIDHYRQPDLDSLADTQKFPDNTNEFDESIAQSEAYEQVVKAMASLPLMQRTVMVLCHYEGFSNAEAAEMTGLSVKAVESLLVRARRTLRAQLAPWMSRSDR